MGEMGDRGAHMRALERLRTELNAGRLPHRYLDRDGNPHENDLPTDIRLLDMRFDNCVRRRADGTLQKISALNVEVFWPKEPTKRAKAKPRPGGRPSRDLEPAKQWLRDNIKANGLAKQEILTERVREHFEQSDPPAPHTKTIETKVVRPVWRELAKLPPEFRS
jgi:hypothetical protein